MKLVDVHCHLNHKYFQDKLNQSIENAKNVGVQAIIVSGTNPLSNREVLELAKKDSILKVSFGLHPIDALGLSEGDTGIVKHQGKVDLEKEFKFIEDNKDKIIGLGEVGLDFQWDADHHQEQKEIFRKVIQLAIKINKPLIVHTWKAEQECVDILEQEVGGKVSVVLHCFTGKKSLITRAKELGFYFSIPPSMKRVGNFVTLVKKVELNQLLTETDAPWQTPFKGEKNEPAFVLETIKEIAKIKKLTEEEVANQIWENYQKVFLK